MARTFQDSLAQDATAVFFNTNEFAELVTLKRGALTSDPIAMIPVNPLHGLSDDESAITKYEQMDFDVLANTYVIRGELLEPRLNDELIRTSGKEYRVLNIPGGQCFEPTGGDGLVLRIHTKRVR